MLKLKNIKKSYTTGTFTQHALKDVSINFRTHEFVSILGPSGSGKTTLLNIIGGLDRYDSGDLIINEKSTKDFSERDWDAYRNSCIGFIFQNYNLIGHLSILENVEMCMTLSGVPNKEKRLKAINALNKVGLKEHIHKKPNQLSGGQMQRVAIARALVNDPEIILADEPTGALDSKTSIQIMDLIKEIANEKLVIMVTHNADLANEYSSRIIELKDGELLSDSNEYSEDEQTDVIKITRTAMNFKTALNLSFRNIITKKGRTLLTAFASSIGIIGIALILSLSNGMDLQIDEFEKNTVSNMPIIINKQTVDIEKMMDSIKVKDDNLESYTSNKKVYSRDLEEEMSVHLNELNEEYINYIKKIDSNLYEGIVYSYSLKYNNLAKVNNEYTNIDLTNELFTLPYTKEKKEYITNNYDILEGKLPTSKEELMLIVDSKNRLDKSLLEQLGFDITKEISFKDIMSKEILFVPNDAYYNKIGEYFKVNSDYEAISNNEKTVKAKITAIIRLKEEKKTLGANQSGIVYIDELTNYMINENKDSEIVKMQKSLDVDVLTGMKLINEEQASIFMMGTTKEQALQNLGGITIPTQVAIYPKDFDTKEKIVNKLDEYNKTKEETEKIVYTDQAAIVTVLSDSMLNTVTFVLVAFSGISLIVSSIMIGIITYISVLERTKEIGILRAIGARKKDIKRVFNAETFIIGLTSGLLGILIARLLLFPINSVIYHVTELKNVAILNPVHAIVLITVSITLTVIGGTIPAHIASKKDPVEALRTE